MGRSARANEPVPNDRVILVDENDHPIGTAEKLTAHVDGLLHRAFSIFLVDEHGRVLLQRRHAAKYHSGGLWANSCCGHPRPGEETAKAAQRRLREELGVIGRLEHRFRARYILSVSNNLVENELVHVYFGALRPPVHPAPLEIDSTALIAVSELLERASSPEIAPWLKHYLTFHVAEIEAGLGRFIPCLNS
jgi:isopentenyl-diphosphate delta-isomerase